MNSQLRVRAAFPILLCAMAVGTANALVAVTLESTAATIASATLMLLLVGVIAVSIVRYRQRRHAVHVTHLPMSTGQST